MKKIIHSVECPRISWRLFRSGSALSLTTGEADLWQCEGKIVICHGDTFCKEKAWCLQRRELLSIFPDRQHYLVRRPYISRRDPKVRCFHTDWIWSRWTNSLTDWYFSSGFPCNRCSAVIDRWDSFKKTDLSFKKKMINDFNPFFRVFNLRENVSKLENWNENDQEIVR